MPVKGKHRVIHLYKSLSSLEKTNDESIMDGWSTRGYGLPELYTVLMDRGTWIIAYHSSTTPE